MACANLWSGGWAATRLFRFFVVRNLEEMAKNAMVSRAASWVNEWWMSCLSNFLVRRSVGLGSVALQWGMFTGQLEMSVGGNSPSMRDVVVVGVGSVNPRAYR